MDGSCIAQTLLSRKLDALAHTIHANIHTDTHTHTHTMVRQDLWKCLLKKESFKLGFEVREGGEIPQSGKQRIPDSWGNELKEQSPTDFR